MILWALSFLKAPILIVILIYILNHSVTYVTINSKCLHSLRNLGSRPLFFVEITNNYQDIQKLGNRKMSSEKNYLF